MGVVTYMDWWSKGWGASIALPMLAINLAETAAFSILLAISWS